MPLRTTALMLLALLFALASAPPASGYYYQGRGSYRDDQAVGGGDSAHPHAHRRPSHSQSPHAHSTHQQAKRAHSQTYGAASHHPQTHPQHYAPPTARPRYARLEQLLSRLAPTEPATPAPLPPPSPYGGRPATAPPPSHPRLHHHGGLHGGAHHAHRGDDRGHPAHDAYAYDDDEGDDDDYDDFDEDDELDDAGMEEDAPANWELPQGHQPGGGGAGAGASGGGSTGPGPGGGASGGPSSGPLPPEGMSPVSRHKWNTMGTRAGVEETRRSRLAASKAQHAPPGNQEAVEHLLRVSREGGCKLPKPRIVQVKQEYPHPHKIYLPRCTILHQCGDDTGCCNAESLTCVPRQTHRVELFFYTSTVGSGVQRVERLSFYNHTECGCEDRNSERLLRDPGILTKSSRGLFPAPAHPPQPRPDHGPPPAPRCRCPSKYAVRQVRDGLCSCDCFDKQRDCLRLKKGKDYFSPQDRLCIQKGECRVPICEFGSYLRLAGRCPKKRERFALWN